MVISLRATRATHLLIVIGVGLVGCGSSGSDDSAAPNPGGNQPPTISGTPPPAVLEVGVAYSFTPTASDPDGDTLTFSITNLPSWVGFSSATGTVTATPTVANVGVYSNIVLSVSDGTVSVALPAFSFEVRAAGPFAVSSTSPGSLATNVGMGTDVVVTFNRDVDGASVSGGSMTVIGPAGAIGGTVSTAGSTVTFDPTSALGELTSYTATVSGSVEDTTGNALGSDYSWQFMTRADSGAPELSVWESEMLTFGDQHCGATDTYYDGIWVYYQIYDYTGDAKWLTCKDNAIQTYLIDMLRAGNYFTGGEWRFSHGVYQDWLRGGVATIDDIRGLRDVPAFSELSEYRNDYVGSYSSMSRETAYALQANIQAERAGEARVLDTTVTPNKLRVQQFVEWIEAHLWQWRSGTCLNPDTTRCRFAPFMFGLTGHALLEFYDWEVANGRDPNAYWPTTHWPDIVTGLADVTRWAYESATAKEGNDAGLLMWVPNGAYGSFRYSDILNGGGTAPAPDLNNLIAPTYGWVYKQTGDVFYRDVGDQLFGGAALNAFLGQEKQFNQSYRTSFSYLQWRAEGDQAP